MHFAFNYAIFAIFQVCSYFTYYTFITMRMHYSASFANVLEKTHPRMMKNLLMVLGLKVHLPTQSSGFQHCSTETHALVPTYF